MLKKKVNGTWSSLANVKKKTNGSWSDCTSVKKKYNGSWSEVWGKKFLDFSFSSVPSLNFSYARGADSVAGGDVTVKLGQRYSNDYGWSRIDVAHNLQANDAVYIDYSFTNSSTADYYMWLAWGYYNRGYIYPGQTILSTENNKRTGTITGTASGTCPEIYDSGRPDLTYQYFSFGVYNDNIYSSYNLGTLKIHRIYSDSKIYYWSTETIKPFE